jgi:hypothetical protein
MGATSSLRASDAWFVCDDAMLTTTAKGMQEHLQTMLCSRMPQLQRKVNAAGTGRCRVVRPCVKGGSALIQGEVQHVQQGYSLALYALETKQVPAPSSWQAGWYDSARWWMTKQSSSHQWEHEWEAVQGDTAAQTAFIDSRLQQAEEAIASAAGQQQQDGGVRGADSSRPAPIVIGLLPQGHPAQPDAGSQQGATTTDASTTHEPPQPVLTPAEAEARLKALQQQALQQQQQAFFKGLPPAPASATSGVTSPTQLLQQQQQPSSLRPPQAPALKPPRRPGA